MSFSLCAVYGEVGYFFVTDYRHHAKPQNRKDNAKKIKLILQNRSDTNFLLKG